MYPKHLTIPMEKELTSNGFTSLKTVEAVDGVLNKTEGTVLVMINSVCGCAAANARPGVKIAMENEKSPQLAVTVFAGVDKEATDRAREYMLPYPPSSPAVALFKDGKLVHFVERHHIEGASAEAIANNLKKAFNAFC